MNKILSLIQNVNINKSIVAIANAADKQVLLAVKEAIEKKYCSFILFDDHKNLITFAEVAGLDLDNPLIEIVDTVSSQAGMEAVKSIRDGRAHILMKGNIPTKTLLQSVLNKEYGLRTSTALSHVAVFEIPTQDRLILLTDAAMNIEPDLKQKSDIIQNAVQVAHQLNIEHPKAAALAPVEVVNEAIPSTIDAALLTQMATRNQIKGCEVEGPLAFDTAVSKLAARHKGLNSNVAGKADILLVPTLEVGNALYKSFVYFANARVASIISGAKVPIVLTSRSDSSESKMYSLLLALTASK